MQCQVRRAEYLKDILKSGGNLTRKREHTLQPGLLEPCAVKVARTVLRGGGDMSPLPDILNIEASGYAFDQAVCRLVQ